MARHDSFPEAGTGDTVMIVPGDDGKLWFWRCVGGVWKRRQPVVFAYDPARPPAQLSQVQCNPNGGVTVTKLGTVGIEALVEGKAQPDKSPTAVKVVAPPRGVNFDAWWAVSIPV